MKMVCNSIQEHGQQDQLQARFRPLEKKDGDVVIDSFNIFGPAAEITDLYTVRGVYEVTVKKVG
jgi:hypothetical protein